MLSEIVVFRRFRNANPATMMIASFALGFVIKYFLLMLYSSRPKSIDLWSNLTQQVEIFGARIPPLQVITIVVTIVILHRAHRLPEAHPLRPRDAGGGGELHHGAHAGRAAPTASSCWPSR